MDWVALIVVSALLLVVAGELAVIILWARRRNPDQLLGRLPQWQEDVLLTLQVQQKTQEELVEEFKALRTDVYKASLQTASARKNELPAPPPTGDAHRALLNAAQALTDSASTLKTRSSVAPEDAGPRLAAVADRFDQAVRDLGKAVRSGFETMTKERQRLWEELEARSGRQQDALLGAFRELQAVFRQASAAPQQTVAPAARAALPETAAPVSPAAAAEPEARAAPVPASAAQPAGPYPSDDTPAAERPSSPTSESPAPARESGAAERPAAVAEARAAEPEDTGFQLLHRWVLRHLELVMNRSLNQWSKPEDLLGAAPDGLSYTARLLDPEAKLVLVGLEGDPRFLALALPGGKIDKMNVEWFSTDEGGVGGRVERTINPAVLVGGATGYRVIHRGRVKPD